MKKYKQKRKLIKINCDHCNKEFSKPISELNRNKKLNRNNYCSRSCSGKSSSNLQHLKSIRSNYDISKHSKNRNDKYTGFRYYYRNCKGRFKDFDITLDDLLEQWHLQNGVCPYTNFNLILYKKNSNTPYENRASLDRIDSSKGYIKGNIEFISLPINYLKNNQLSKEQTKNLLAKISLNFH